MFVNVIQLEHFEHQLLLNLSTFILPNLSRFRNPTAPTHLHRLLQLAQTDQLNQITADHVNNFMHRTTTIQIILASALILWTISLLYCMIKGKFLQWKRHKANKPLVQTSD